MPRPWDDHEEQQKQWSGASLRLEAKLCVLQRAELVQGPELLGGAQKMLSESHVMDIEFFTPLQFVLLCSDCGCNIVFSS